MAPIRYTLLALALLVGYSVSAQQLTNYPDAPSHKFFNKNNLAAFGTLSGLIAVDAVTTQQLTTSYRAVEGNPLWRPMVRQGWAGEMAASALGFSAAVGVAYTFHKTGHHKMERWANWLTVAMEAGNDAHNLMLTWR
jgi:hypothetical protein